MGLVEMRGSRDVPVLSHHKDAAAGAHQHHMLCDLLEKQPLQTSVVKGPNVSLAVR